MTSSLLILGSILGLALLGAMAIAGVIVWMAAHEIPEDGDGPEHWNN